ncbi:MAG: hypothetical protein KDI17_16520 [Halioglobus sp.]|nr:hypothetical protein [Halioglobus sp.]
MSNSAPQLTINLPHGDVATYEEMQAYGDILQRFIREQEAALEQVKDITRHNQIVDYLRLLARSYNEQLRLYKAAEAKRQRETLIVLLKIGGNPVLH